MGVWCLGVMGGGGLWLIFSFYGWEMPGMFYVWGFYIYIKLLTEKKY